jgi:hypothetical protein
MNVRSAALGSGTAGVRSRLLQELLNPPLHQLVDRTAAAFQLQRLEPEARRSWWPPERPTESSTARLYPERARGPGCRPAMTVARASSPLADGLESVGAEMSRHAPPEIIRRAVRTRPVVLSRDCLRYERSVHHAASSSRPQCPVVTATTPRRASMTSRSSDCCCVMGRASIIFVAQGGVYPMVAHIFSTNNRASRSS